MMKNIKFRKAKVKKKYNLVLIIFILLVFALACFFIYKFIDNNKINDKLEYGTEKIEVDEILYAEDRLFYTKIENKSLSLFDEENNCIVTGYTEINGPIEMDNHYYFNFRTKNNKMGLTDEKGNIIIEPEYKMVSCTNSVCTGTTEEYIRLIDLKGKVLYEMPNQKYYQNYKDEFTNEIEFFFYNQDYSPLIKDEKLGIIDKKGNVIINPKYEVLIQDEKDYHLIKEEIITKVMKTSRGYYFSMRYGNKIGVIDHLDRKVVDFKYDNIIYDEIADSFIGTIGNKHYIINFEGEVQKQFDQNILINGNQLQEYMSNPNYSFYYISREGNLLIDKKLNLIEDNILSVGSKSYIAIVEDGYVLKNFNKDIILDTRGIMYYTDTLDRVIACDITDEGNHENCSLFAEDGKTLTEEKYDEIYTFDIDNDNLLKTVKGNKCGIIDINGKNIVALNDAHSKLDMCLYSSLGKDGYYVVTSMNFLDNNINTVVDKNNKEVIKASEAFETFYVEDNLIVKRNYESKTEILNLNGTVLKTGLNDEDFLDTFMFKKGKYYYFTSYDSEDGKSYIYKLYKK